MKNSRLFKYLVIDSINLYCASTFVICIKLALQEVEKEGHVKILSSFLIRSIKNTNSKSNGLAYPKIESNGNISNITSYHTTYKELKGF